MRLRLRSASDADQETGVAYLVFVVTLLSLSVSTALAASPDVEHFHRRVKALYNVPPRTLDENQQEQNSKTLDAFWNEVKSAPNQYAPLLRAELSRSDNTPYFYMDGSNLLIEISKTPLDLNTVAAALRRVDMRDVSDDSYFNLVHWLGVQGIDIVELIQPILDNPAFKVSVPEHSWSMDQQVAVISCILLLEPKRVVDVLSVRLRREKNAAVAHTLIVAMASTITEEANKVLQGYADHPTLPALGADARTYSRFERQASLPGVKLTLGRNQFESHLKAFMNREYDTPGVDVQRFTKEAAYLVRKGDLQRLRALRRERAARVSDEAWGEVTFLTQLMQYAMTATD